MRLAQLERDGFQIVPELFCGTEIQGIIELLESEAESLRGSARGGTRDVLDRLPLLRELAQNAAILNIVRGALGEGAFVARATLFDKTPEANWKVPWHQDVTIAVQEKREVAGYGPWSTKAGVVHVQPPTEVLERMLTVRVHLDECAATNGALRVMPGSHRLGRLDQNAVGGFVDEGSAVCCSANAGDALVMRPLLLHASSAAVYPQHRRVLHFDYAVGELAGGLEWKMR
jgi:ectoine hydroxylase-related dioxygenase (phytanoyl-CoA dioxygenase family)